MNLLIVDDFPTDLKLLRAQLEAEGHAVFEAHDGVDALALLDRQRVDAVISDILMPRMDGYRLCHEIRMNVRLHDLPFILYTSIFTSLGDEKLALNVGADKYLPKPAFVETIIAALHEVIAMPHAASQPKALQEVEVLKEYSERLVSKLKEKNTELQAQTEALRQAEAKYRSIFDNAVEGIFQTTPAGEYLMANPAIARILGYSSPEELMRERTDIIHQGYLQPERRKVFQQLIAAQDFVSGFEYQARRKDGSDVWISENAHTVRDATGRILYYEGTIKDITERKQAEEERAQLFEEVQDSHDRLQRLSGRMLEVQEEERRRLARDLHDQTGQSLTSLLIGLRTLEDASTLEETRVQARNLRTITAQALDEVKRLAIGLRPALLDDLGLEAAITRLAEESTQNYHLAVDLHVKGLPTHRLPPPVETGLYRLAQEALTNAGRHAAAQNVSILLTCSESSVKLIVEDDGRGFDVEKALRLPGSSNHLGLMGMRERVALLNGTLSVESTPGSGTTIYVQLPLEARPS